MDLEVILYEPFSAEICVGLSDDALRFMVGVVLKGVENVTVWDPFVFAVLTYKVKVPLSLVGAAVAVPDIPNIVLPFTILAAVKPIKLAKVEYAIYNLLDVL